ncbi:MAG: hypothetical protein JNL67_02055 [Planctomycetaceae bacterium]|nr:hypothetical protein [Planctomycetaceae bacterium]
MSYSRIPQPSLPSAKLACRRLIVGFLASFAICSSFNPVIAQEMIPGTAVRQVAWSNEAVEVFRDGDRLLLSVQPTGLAAKRVSLPRLYAMVHSWGWMGAPNAKLLLISEPNEWIFEWPDDAPTGNTIELQLISAPEILEQPPVSQPTADGSIWLGAHQARTFGSRLRYEPQPHKNTVGYWTDAQDFAVWEFEVDQPGHFAVAILQGCGAGQGGSEANLSVRREESETVTLPFQVEDTGHFQNFRWRTIGLVELKSLGRHELQLGAVKIANAALMDVRAIHLIRQANTGK